MAEKQYSSNAYYVFKILSLIEMLLINPSNNGRTQGEIERKLPQFLSNRIDNSKKTLYAEYMRKCRNKIAHGDSEFIAKLLKDYRNEFMKNFWYDEFEYSIDNWTYGNISLELDEALNNILGFMLNDKTAWENLRTN